MGSSAERPAGHEEGASMDGVTEQSEQATHVNGDRTPRGEHLDGDVDGDDEASRLKDLAADVRDQDDLERDVGRQADQLLIEQADERDQKRLEKTEIEKSKLQSQVQRLREKLRRPTGSATTARTEAEIAQTEARIRELDDDVRQIQERITQRHSDEPEDGGSLLEESGNRRQPNESQRDFLIRTGKITPFSKVPGRSMVRSESTLQGVLLDAEEGQDEEDITTEVEDNKDVLEKLSHRNLAQPGFAGDDFSETASLPSGSSDRSAKRRRLQSKSKQTQLPHRPRYATDGTRVGQEDADEDEEFSADDGSDVYSPGLDDREIAALGDSEHDSEDGVEEENLIPDTDPQKIKPRGKRKASRNLEEAGAENLARLDDGNEEFYKQRIDDWVHRRSAARKRALSKKEVKAGERGCQTLDELTAEGNQDQDEATAECEWHLPHPTEPDTYFDGGYRVPGDVYPSLFNYQKTGVQWLWELYSQQVGGIVGDEMGLGKTIQIISFLAGLHYSRKLTRPVIVVAPATVMKQWVNEFHTWWPAFRVSILHTSGSGMINIGREAEREGDLLSMQPGSGQKPKTKAHRAAKRIVNRVVAEGHVLVTTYSGLQNYAELLVPVDWEYAVLDEGHKIRNPNASITIYCKELRTANRIILSGTPMQNNLVELWSLFDFVFPMRLGTLVNFRQQFEVPIREGGYANASNLQVQTAMKCAETLKDTISPYLLQRFKVDVASDLPAKSEKVLFCKLTKLQREIYEGFLDSDELKAIMDGKRQVLYGIDILRKICNHPDLQDHKTLSKKVGYHYGSGAKSGKMQVVKELLQLWKKQGHKTLLFAQHRIMLDILETFVNTMTGFRYYRMDGSTPIGTRQGLVDGFNKDPALHVFLLTTKVGGLGINLTGADRVIIYDPDWNPSTDIQARERAWRLGQKREVMIYRLMTAGTIEEKIYHRQLFKTFLTNKILRDPKQRQTFQMKDLHDLFSLGGADQLTTETNGLFKGTEVKFAKEEPATTAAAPADEAPLPTRDDQDAASIPRMAGVASLERYRGEDTGDEESTDVQGSKSEARVMEGIFARAGVHSALEHDQIVNGQRKAVADPRLVEAEAKKVAAEAAKELRKAGELARNVPVGTPTWTGEYGSAGRPEQRPVQRGLGRGRGGPASSSILANLQNRQATGTGLNISRPSSLGGRDSRGSTPAPGGMDFMKMIRDYLVTHGGAVHTQMLIDHFNRFCNNAQKTMEFKEMLKEIATLDKGTRGRGKWVLKEEYR